MDLYRKTDRRSNFCFYILDYRCLFKKTQQSPPPLWIFGLYSRSSDESGQALLWYWSGLVPRVSFTYYYQQLISVTKTFCLLNYPLRGGVSCWRGSTSTDDLHRSQKFVLPALCTLVESLPSSLFTCWTFNSITAQRTRTFRRTPCPDLLILASELQHIINPCIMLPGTPAKLRDVPPGNIFVPQVQ